MSRGGAKHSDASLRIIAGRWGGRRIQFLDDGVRPTSDRVRETLFNWLAPELNGARCLDLYAGAGALGIEALSRGAAAVCFVDDNARVTRQLKSQLELLEAEAATVLTARAESLNFSQHGPFDVVFLDPPFDGVDLSTLCEQLEEAKAVKPGGHVYAEMRRSQPWPVMPANWQSLREKTAGQVRDGLAQVQS